MPTDFDDSSHLRDRQARSLRSRAFRALRARARPPPPPEFSPHFTTFPGRPQTAVHKKFAI